MKILLVGKDGQVGSSLLPKIQKLGEVVSWGRKDFDLKKLDHVRPDLILNAAAYTDVEKAEVEEELAFALNRDLPKSLAEWSSRNQAFLVHYSTDYVFDGSGKKPWKEDDATGPLNIYGKSKLEGEQAIQKATPNYYIFRTSWVHSPTGKNFVKTILQLGLEKEELKIVSDQIGAPTTAKVIAENTVEILRQKRVPGVYHLTCKGETSWYGFAQAIFSKAKEKGTPLKVKRLIPIPTSEYPSKAKRPLNSRLDLKKITQTFGISLPDWKDFE